MPASPPKLVNTSLTEAALKSYFEPFYCQFTTFRPQASPCRRHTQSLLSYTPKPTRLRGYVRVPLPWNSTTSARLITTYLQVLEVVQDLIASVKTSEPGTLRYEWYKSVDNTGGHRLTVVEKCVTSKPPKRVLL